MADPKLEVLTPLNSQIIFIDHQPQMAFGVQSIDRQVLKKVLVQFTPEINTSRKAKSPLLAVPMRRSRQWAHLSLSRLSRLNWPFRSGRS